MRVVRRQKASVLFFVEDRNAPHQRAGAIRVDFKTDPTAGSVAWYARQGRELVGCKSPVQIRELNWRTGYQM